MQKRDAIITVLPGDRLGGAEQYLRNIAVHFSRTGFEVHAVFLTRRKGNDWDDVPDNLNMHFSRAWSEKGGLFFIVRRIFRISRRCRVRYTFSSNTHINSFLGLLRWARVLKTGKLVVRESTTILTRFKGLKRLIFVMHYRMGYRFADLVICQTERMRDELWSYLPLSRNWNIRVVRNPVDPDYIRRMASEKPSAAVRDAGEYIVGAGRLIRIKGFDILIDAFSRIAPSHPQLNLVILGEGELRGSLEEKASRLGISGRVILPGRVSNPVVWFREARLCVVSSLVEGFPNVLLQMMSQCGRVVSTTCAGGIDKIEGLLTCPAGDAAGLAEKIEAGLNMDDTSETRRQFDSFLDDNTVGKFVNRIIKIC
ncbi:MAG: glycosyltransferase [Candidatus Krumholzibacteriales bacterium]